MGWWNANELGSMELDNDSQRIIGLWGDEPADLIENALDDIIRSFYRDHGRAPSISEISAGAEWMKTVYRERLTAAMREN